MGASASVAGAELAVLDQEVLSPVKAKECFDLSGNSLRLVSVIARCSPRVGSVASVSVDVREVAALSKHGGVVVPVADYGVSEGLHNVAVIGVRNRQGGLALSAGNGVLVEPNATNEVTGVTAVSVEDLVLEGFGDPVVDKN